MFLGWGLKDKKGEAFTSCFYYNQQRYACDKGIYLGPYNQSGWSHKKHETLRLSRPWGKLDNNSQLKNIKYIICSHNINFPGPELYELFHPSIYQRPLNWEGPRLTIQFWLWNCSFHRFLDAMPCGRVLRRNMYSLTHPAVALLKFPNQIQIRLLVSSTCIVASPFLWERC